MGSPGSFDLLRPIGTTVAGTPTALNIAVYITLIGLKYDSLWYVATPDPGNDGHIRTPSSPNNS